jgi:hypothetical protein
MFNFFKRKISKESLLDDEDIEKLKQIEKNSYMKEAEKLAVDKGIMKAKKDYNKRREVELW